VHGLAGAIGNWKDVLERLTEEYHAYALDQRGHGGSGKPGSYQLAEFVEDIYAFSRELGIGRFTYVGHSMGGKVGIKFAMDHPEVLKGLVLVAPAPANEYITRDMVAPVLDATGVDDVPTALAYGMFGSPEAIRGTVSQMFATPPSEELTNELVNDAMAAGPDVMREVFTWLLSDLEPQLGDIRVPTLIVPGAKDTIPLDYTKRTANGIKGCRFEVFEDAGHFPPLETPQEVVDLLTSFIEDVSIG
jgi:branched-chain amino acid transport system permease protein